MEGLFSFGLLFLVVLAVVVVGFAIYAARLRRRDESMAPARDTAMPSGRPAGTAPDGTAASPADVSAPPDAPHEYFKSMGLETGEEMKMRVYSLDEYAEELGGDAHAARSGHHIAVLKAYRPVDDGWYDYPPDRAARVLGLAPEDYEVDAQHGALLLKRLPHGLPRSARDVL